MKRYLAFPIMLPHPVGISLTFSSKTKAIKRQVVFHILFDVCLILTKICERNINITCVFIVLVFEEKVNEILTYNAIIVQHILYYYMYYIISCSAIGASQGDF